MADSDPARTKGLDETSAGVLAAFDMRADAAPQTVTPHAVTVAEPDSDTPRALRLPARAHGESDSAWQRYCWWVAAPERGERRSWAATARHFGVDESSIRSTADAYSWLERGIRADKVRTVRAAAVAGQLQAEAVSSHIVLAEQLVSQANTMLLRCEEMQDVDPELWTNIAAKTAKILKDASGVARLSVGLATVRVEGADAAAPKLDLSRLTHDELRLFATCDALQVIASPAASLSDVERARTEVRQMLDQLRNQKSA